LVTTLLHFSDLHFGRDADLAQVRALEAYTAAVRPTAVVISGDLTQRSRHGELQRALAFREALERTAPVFVVPGNHDVEWWRTPLDLFGSAVKHLKYRRYFGDDLSPSLALPGMVIASVLTSHGTAVGSLTWKWWRDTAVKGHLPTAEVAKAKARLATAGRGDLRVLVLHHNVLRGQISRRMGLARWRSAQEALAGSGADLILCGHDHQEDVGTLPGGIVVATAGTHTGRTRGHRPSAFNTIEITATEIAVTHQCWRAETGSFSPGSERRFPRPVR
jgi:3',5'-cyclic AMP phosphodiesterase CpdA